MRIRRESAAWFQLPPEVLQFLFGDTALEVSTGVHSGRGVSLEIDSVAVAGFRGCLKKVIERHFVERGRRRKRGNVSANAFLNLISADHHGQGVPAHQALDAALHFLAAGKWRLLPGRDRILIGSRRRKRQVDPSLAPGMQRQLLQKPPRTVRSAVREYIIQRVQPLPRFQYFDSVRLLGFGHAAPTSKNAIFHHKQSGRILLRGRRN